jgi:hypothetical protein
MLFEEFNDSMAVAIDHIEANSQLDPENPVSFDSGK